MAGKIDINKLAERLAQINERRNNSGGPNLDFIDINDGLNVLRILPPKKDGDWFAQEVWVHYGVGKTEANKKGTMVICPTTNGDDKPCPVCELAKQFYKMSAKKDDKYSKMGRDIGRKKRVYYNAISRADDLSQFEKNDDGKWMNTSTSEEECPVKILATGQGVYTDLMGIIVDPEYGDVTDPEKGLDIRITKSGSGQFNTKYEVKTNRKESPIGFDGWEECLHDLSVLATPKTYDEIAALMTGATESTDNTEDDKKDDAQDNNSADTSSNTNSEPDKSEDDIQAEIQAALARRKKK